MEALLTSHRREARDLQSRITQKKKAATKKTRKTVNEECEGLERDLRERQRQEIAAFEAAENGAVEEGITNGALCNVGTKAEDRGGQAAEEEEGSVGEKNKEGQNHDRDVNGTATELGGMSLYGSEPRQQRKPNRQKARLARRAAEHEELARQAAKEAEHMPDQKQREREVMLEQFAKRGLKEKEIRADGHCLYAAVADGLKSAGLGLEPSRAEETQKEEDYRTVRKAAAKYIETHSEDFVPFLEEPLEEYVVKVRDTGEWGGQLELLALAKVYGVDVSVLQGDGSMVDIEGEGVDKKRLWLAYYKHNFGLGEHYNSLRKER